LNNLAKENTNHFGINKLGELFLIQELDYERERHIELTIRVSDMSSNPLDVRQTVTFSISNINDNPPIFSAFPTVGNDGNCRLEISEGTDSNNNVLFTFKATDADQVTTDPFKFEIIEITTIDKKTPGFQERLVEGNVFNIGLQTGQLTLDPKQQLDRENIDNYKIVIRLSDQPLFKVQLTTMKECYVQVMDINDNAPKFMPEQLFKNNTEFKVFPLVNEMTVINWFGATDADLGNNGTVEYQLLMNDELTESIGHVFSIDTKGYLLLDGHSLQSENVFDLNEVYDFTVVARDRGKPRLLESVINLKIKIDENYFRISRTSIDRLELDTLNGHGIVEVEENLEVGSVVGEIVVRNSLARSNSTQASRDQVKLRFKLLTCNETFRFVHLSFLNLKCLK
jgi:hypothetical protein